MSQFAKKSLLTSLIAAAILMSGCATNKKAVETAAPAEPAKTAPAAPASVAAAPAPVAAPAPAAPAAAPAAATAQDSKLSGNWEGKWIIDGVGLEGKIVLNITGMEGNVVKGKATLFDTPYGDLTEDFSPATFDGSKLQVKHSNGAVYTLTLSEKDGKTRLRGPLNYATESGTYTGKVQVEKK